MVKRRLPGFEAMLIELSMEYIFWLFISWLERSAKVLLKVLLALLLATVTCACPLRARLGLQSGARQHRYEGCVSRLKVTFGCNDDSFASFKRPGRCPLENNAFSPALRANHPAEAGCFNRPFWAKVNSDVKQAAAPYAFFFLPKRGLTLGFDIKRSLATRPQSPTDPFASLLFRFRRENS